jgi:hypothetical protein
MLGEVCWRSEDFESPVSQLEKQNAPRENEGDPVPDNQWRIFQERAIAKPKNSSEHEHKIHAERNVIG